MIRFNFSRVSVSVAIVFVILIAGTALRLVDLDHTPDGLHADEASYLLNTISLLDSARDEDNRFLPLSLHSLTDPKPALYSYLQIPFVAIFGATTASSRIPGALLGILSLFVVYRIFRQHESRTMGILTLFVLAVSPWHVVMSRGTQEVITSFLFFCLALAAVFNYLQRPTKSSALLYGVFSSLSMYMYHSAKIVIPMFVCIYALALLQQGTIKIRQTVTLILGSLIALGFSLLAQNSAIRLQTLSILNSPTPQSYILEQIYAATPIAPQPLLRTFYNKPVFYGREVLMQYSAYFSPKFLFFEWSEPKRYTAPFHGLLYLIELPLLLLGLYAVAKRPKFFGFPMLILLLLAPIPAIVTAQEIPSTIRSFVMIIPLTYFVARGLAKLFEIKSKSMKTVLLTLVAGSYLVFFSYFLMQYGIQQKVHQPWYRNVPYQRIATKLGSYEAKFSSVVVTSDLRPLYAYFVLANLIDSKQLREQPQARFLNDYSLNKYSFAQQHCVPDKWSSDTLYILESACITELREIPLTVLETISYADGESAYVFATYQE